MMKRQLLFLLAFLASALAIEDYSGSQLLRLHLRSKSQLKAVVGLSNLQTSLDFWLEPSTVRPTDLYVPRDQVEYAKAFLNQFHIEHEVSIPDVGKLIQDQAAESKKKGKQDGEMNWENYQSYDTIMDYVDLLGAQYPDLATVERYGTSTEGRPLNVIKIGRNTTTQKPAFFFDGGMHAREWISPAIVTYFMRELLQNPSNNDILDSVDIYITPIANPDGYEYTRTVQRLWRKTRSDNGSPLRCMGVDPNRNFEYEWGGPGTSAEPCSDIYKGEGPFSEPETRGMSEYIQRKSDEGVNWVSYFAIHSYAQMWLVPWGWTFDLPPTYDELIEFGNVGASALKDVHGTIFEVGSVTELLTPGAGGSDDWAYGSGLFRFSQTVEVRDTGRYGFLLPPDQIIPCAEETFAAIQAVARFVVNKV